MALTRLITWQLRIFGSITVVSLGLTLFAYAKVPSMLGIGVYDVHVDFADASGLYPRAQVTFHGVKVGRVTGLEVSDDGAIATLRIKNGVDIPSGARAELHSTSAIGEQYVDLVSDDADGPYLADGAEIPRERAIAMPQITPMLDSLNRLLASVPREQTRRVLSAVGDGLGGRSEDLGGIIDASANLVTEAQANIGATTSLIAALQPVLATQNDLGKRTAGYAKALNDLTATLAVQNGADLRALLRAGPGGLDELTGTVADLQPTLPLFVANATINARVPNAYLPHLRQFLVVYPATIARLQGVANSRAEFGDARFDLRASFNDPPSCRSGYLPPSERRSPSDTTPRHTNPLAHCTIPDDDPIAARGARNLPCPSSARRGPLPVDCGLVFDRGIWPDTENVETYDLAVERDDRSHELDLESGKGDDLWKILVLAPLSLS